MNCNEVAYDVALGRERMRSFLWLPRATFKFICISLHE